MISELRIPRRAIALIVAETFGFKINDLIGPVRRRDVCVARFAAFHLIREVRPDTSLPECGRVLGGRDHTTVLHGLDRCAELIASDESYRNKVATARKRIAAWRPTDGRELAALVFAPIPVAKAEEPPPAVKSEPTIAIERIRHAGMGPDAHAQITSRWWAQNDERFRAAMAAAHPERVQAPISEAAE